MSVAMIASTVRFSMDSVFACKLADLVIIMSLDFGFIVFLILAFVVVFHSLFFLLS